MMRKVFSLSPGRLESMISDRWSAAASPRRRTASDNRAGDWKNREEDCGDREVVAVESRASLLLPTW
jgi:hypothetical protein